MNKGNFIKPDFKPSPLGPIPRDWEVKELREISNITSSKRIMMDEYISSGIPFFRSKEIIEKINGKETQSEIYISENRYLDIKKRFGAPEANQILITAVGSLGQAYLIKNTDLPFYFKDGNLIWLKEINDIDFDINFLLSYFKSDNFKKDIDESTYGSSQKALTIENLNKFAIPLPPLPEQRAIAACLSTWDNAITKVQALLAQKELRKKWLMQQLLAGKKRLKGFNGEWRKEKLEKFLVKHDEKTTVNNQYPVLTSSRRGLFLQSDYYTRDVASEDNTCYNVVPRGYFTYRHMSDDLIFKFNINNIVDKGIVSTLYPVFSTKNINDYFLLSKLNEGSEFKIHAGEQKQGGSRTYIYFSTLCQLIINYPSLKEQTAIAQVLQAADKEIQLLKAMADKLKEEKQGLMQVLLTGKKRLKLINH